MDKVDWMIHSAVSCPEVNDKCVKIIEQRGGKRVETRQAATGHTDHTDHDCRFAVDLTVTRDCLSAVMPYRNDIPADHFEGCRPAADDPKRSVYVDNPIAELELKPSRYTNVTFCFCEFDQWCNRAPPATVWPLLTIAFSLSASLLILL